MIFSCFFFCFVLVFLVFLEEGWRGRRGRWRRCCRKPQNEQSSLSRTEIFKKRCRSRRFIKNVCRSSQSNFTMQQKKETNVLNVLPNISLLGLKWFKQSVNSFSFNFQLVSAHDVIQLFLSYVFLPFLKEKAFMSVTNH